MTEVVTAHTFVALVILTDYTDLISVERGKASRPLPDMLNGWVNNVHPIHGQSQVQVAMR